MQNRIEIPQTAAIFHPERDHTTTTGKYVLTPDKDILMELQDNGWVPVQYTEQKRQKKTLERGRAGTQKYLVRYSHPDFTSEEGDFSLLQISSRDGTTPFQLRGGFFRFACANGLVVGSDAFTPFRVRHKGNAIDIINEFMKGIQERVANVYSTIEQRQATQMTELQQIEFAREAIQLRFPNRDSLPKAELVLVPRRSQDQGDSVWNVFNRVQEHLVQCDRIEIPWTNKHGVEKTRKPKALSTLNSVQFNEQLWNASSRYVV